MATDETKAGDQKVPPSKPVVTEESGPKGVAVKPEKSEEEKAKVLSKSIVPGYPDVTVGDADLRDAPYTSPRLISRAITLQGLPTFNEYGKAEVGTVVPGMLVEGLKLIKPHAGGTPIARTFALERDELGNNIDVAYAVGDTVKVGSFAPGDVVNALMVSGAVTAGQFVMSNGDGKLKVGSTNPVGRAMEDQLAGSNRCAIELI